MDELRDEDRLLNLAKDSNQITEAARSVINENLALRAECDRLRAGIMTAEVHGEMIVRMRESVWLRVEAERDLLRTLSERLVEIDDRRAAVVVATQHDHIDVGVREMAPVMSEYRAVIADLRELLDANSGGD
jgi:hypothetical protein